MSAVHCRICDGTSSVILGDGPPRCLYCVWEMAQAAKYAVDEAKYLARPLSVAELQRRIGYQGGTTR